MSDTSPKAFTMPYTTPNPDGLNNDRAAAASSALKHFARSGMGELIDGRLSGPDFDLRAQNLTDLLCDFAHFCDREELNFGKLLCDAQASYRAETDNKGRQSFNAASPALRAVEGEPLTCPRCKSGTLQEVRDASVTRAILGSRTVHAGKVGGYTYTEAVLSQVDDVNTYDDARLCCNECDADFDEDEIAELDNDDDTCECPPPLRLAVLTVEEDKAWTTAFTTAVVDLGLDDDAADTAAWAAVQKQFPRLRGFAGCTPSEPTPAW